MTEDDFWAIIEGTRAVEDTENARTTALDDQLSGMERGALESFAVLQSEIVRRAYRWDLWAAATVMNGGMSDDGSALRWSSSSRMSPR